MTLGKILIAGAALAAIAAPAMAQTFNWSFDNSREGAPDQFVTGTISGLSEGVNNASGLTVTVDSMPGSEMLGPFNYGFAGGTFTVTDGEITAAQAYFNINDEILLDFSTDVTSQYIPSFNYTIHPSFDEFDVIFQYMSNNPETFSRVEEQGPVPEPASWALMVGGFGLTGAAMRRRKRAVCFA